MPDMKNLIVGNNTYTIVDNRLQTNTVNFIEAGYNSTYASYNLNIMNSNGDTISLNNLGDNTNGRRPVLTLLPNNDWKQAVQVGQLAFVSDLPSTTTPSISITDSTGTSSEVKVRRFGNVVHLTLKVKNPSATTNNAIIYSGTIATTNLRPVLLIQNSFSYGGAFHTNGWITTAGVINVRHMGTGSLPANTNIDISFVYLIA